MLSLILAGAVIVVSLLAIAVQAKLMSRQAFAGFLLALIVVLSGGNLVLSLANQQHLNGSVIDVCVGQREIARTTAEALVEQTEESSSFLARSHFPGFTDEELQAKVHNKTLKATARSRRLENVADKTCKGV